MRLPLLPLMIVLAASSVAQTPAPQTTPVRRGSGWAEPWQGRLELGPMLQVNLATGNLVCAISTGRFWEQGLAPRHEVRLIHNAQRASVSGDFTGGFDLGGGWSSNLGVSLSFPAAGVAKLVLGDGNEIGFLDQGGAWASEAGSFLTLEAEGAGWVVTNKERWKLHLDLVGRLASVESPAGNSYVITWGSNGVSSAVEPSGRGSTFHYDAQGRLQTVDYPNESLWTLSYNASGRLESVTNSAFGDVSIIYDGSGRIASLTDYRGATWAFDYWNGGWADRLRKVTFPDQTEISLAYSGLINRVITTITGLRGEQWKSVHDVADSPALMATIDPYSKVAVYSHDADKLRVSYKNELGREWTYAYDAQGNLATLTDPLLRSTSFLHDALDRLKHVELDGEKTYTFYNDPDQERLPTSVVEPRDDQNVAATTTLEYFGPLEGPAPGAWKGWLRELVDGEGVSTRFDFDDLGVLTTVHEGPEGETGRIEARFEGRLGPTYVDHGGMGYPSHFPSLPAPPPQVQGRLEWSVAPGGDWDWRGLATARSFDVTVPIDSGGGWETSNILRTYERDHWGRVTEFTEQSEETLAHATSPPSTPPTRIICVTHEDDAPDGSTEMLLPNGDEWIWRRDLAGRVTSVSLDDGAGETTICTLSYYDDGSLKTKSCAGGASSHYTYEDNGLVESIEHRLGSTVLLHLHYDYDDANLPIILTEASASGTLVKSYTYDQRRRLRSECRDDGTTVEERSYVYDQVGNRIQREVRVGGVVQETTTYHYDREDVATYHSDNHRLMWSETVDGSAQLLERTWYIYGNPFGNVSRIVSNAAGSAAFESTVFVYTEFGQPWLFWEESWDDLGAGPVNVVRGDVIEQRTDLVIPRLWRRRDGATFAPIGTAEWSTNFSLLSMAYAVDGTTAAQTEQGARLPGIGRLHGSAFTAELSDAIGSVRRTVRNSVVTKMDYLAFGESLDATDEPYGFAGVLGARRRFDGVDFGGGELVQMGWRLLLPDTGRFAMRDPSGINGGPNVYSFVHNAPTWMVDPTGQQGEPDNPWPWENVETPCLPYSGGRQAVCPGCLGSWPVGYNGPGAPEPPGGCGWPTPPPQPPKDPPPKERSTVGPPAVFWWFSNPLGGRYEGPQEDPPPGSSPGPGFGPPPGVDSPSSGG